MQIALIPDEQIVIPYDPADVERLIEAPALAVDIETDTEWHGIGPSKDFGLSYCASITYVSLAARFEPDGEIMTQVFAAPFDDAVQNYIRRVMTRQLTTIGHNIVFDARSLSRFSDNQVPAHIWDTMVMARLIHPERQENYGMLDVAQGLGVEFHAWMRDMKKLRGALHTVDPEQIAAYVAADTIVTLKIYEAQCAFIAELATSDPDRRAELVDLIDWECRAMRCYSQMAAVGTRLNVSYTQQRIDELKVVVVQARELLARDGLSDPNSPKQRAAYIYGVKRIPIPDWEPLSDYYTNKAHKLIAQAQRGGPQVLLTILGNDLLSKQQIIGNDDNNVETVTLEVSQLSTSADVIDSFCGNADAPYYTELKALADFIAADRMLATLKVLLEHAALDERVHSLVSPMTHTGRRTSGHPQVQNWKMAQAPADDPAGDMCGIACGDDDESLLIEIDYSNAENWIAAMLSGDDNLAAACASEDFHSAMAASYFPTEWEQADKAERKRLRFKGKAITFGSAYGMGAKLLSLRIKSTVDEARAVLAAKDVAFPYVAQAKEATTRVISERGYVKLWTGRRVLCDERGSYKGWNYLCQGAVGEMVKRSIVLITETFERRHMKSRIALDMHDAIVMSVPCAEVEAACAIASHIMETIIPDELNQRTSPAIKWTAKADLTENAKKWGKFQTCPALPEIPITDVAALIAEDDGISAKSVQHASVRPDPVSNVMVKIPDVGFAFLAQFPVNYAYRDMTIDNLREVIHFFEALMTAFEDTLKTTYPSRVPLDDQNAINYGNQDNPVIVSDEVKVSLHDWVHLPLLWATVAQFQDTTELIGMTRDELMATHQYRANWVASVRTRLDNAADKYSRLLRYISTRIEQEFIDAQTA